jgi:hypothetical protein
MLHGIPRTTCGCSWHGAVRVAARVAGRAGRAPCSGRTAGRAERGHLRFQPCSRIHTPADMRRCQARVQACVCTGLCVSCACDGGAGIRRTCTQQLRIGVRDALSVCVPVDAAADCEPETAGRNGREVHSATIPLAADGRQALARRLGLDLRIASSAHLAVFRADERCTTRWAAVDDAATGASPTMARTEAQRGCSLACTGRPGAATIRTRHTIAKRFTAMHSAARTAHAATALEDALGAAAVCSSTTEPTGAWPSPSRGLNEIGAPEPATPQEGPSAGLYVFVCIYLST